MCIYMYIYVHIKYVFINIYIYPMTDPAGAGRKMLTLIGGFC